MKFGSVCVLHLVLTALFLCLLNRIVYGVLLKQSVEHTPNLECRNKKSVGSLGVYLTKSKGSYLTDILSWRCSS
jgi:hypothetical protein